MITIFEMKYVENERVVSSKPTVGEQRYFDMMPQRVNVTGVKIPNKTGIQVGHF